MSRGNATSASTSSENSNTISRFYNVVKSIKEFDEHEVHGVVATLLSKTDREQCFLATYYRSVANVETLLTLDGAKHFQAIAMLARGLFELAVDIRLIDVVANGPAKMILFPDVEKLRCAQKIVKFKNSNPGASVDSAEFDTFISIEEQRIKLAQTAMWPNLNRVKHWSGCNLDERVRLLGSPFDQIYEVNYPQLSWYVHSGLTGIINVRSETFGLMCGIAFKLAADSYREILLAIIREFRIMKADEKIEQKLQAAKMLPFTDSPEQAGQLLKELLE